MSRADAAIVSPTEERLIAAITTNLQPSLPPQPPGGSSGKKFTRGHFSCKCSVEGCGKSVSIMLFGDGELALFCVCVCVCLFVFVLVCGSLWCCV